MTAISIFMNIICFHHLKIFPQKIQYASKFQLLSSERIMPGIVSLYLFHLISNKYKYTVYIFT